MTWTPLKNLEGDRTGPPPKVLSVNMYALDPTPSLKNESNHPTSNHYYN